MEGGADAAFLTQKMLTARFFAETYLPQAAAAIAGMESSARTIVAADFSSSQL
jgi:hypothetical protein